MKYIITESQLNKVYEKYFNMEFKNSYLNNNIKLDDGSTWVGICINNNSEEIMLVGRPIDSDDEFWYYNGPYFEYTPSLLDVGYEQFAKMLRDYVNGRFDLKIKKVT